MVLESTLAADVKAFSLRPPALLCAAAFLVVTCLIRYLLKRPPKLNLPVIEPEGVHYSTEDLSEASRKVGVIQIHTALRGFNTNLDLDQYPDTPFLLRLSPPMVVLPPSALEEVRNLPENQVSFLKDMKRQFAGEHTGVGDTSPEVIDVVKFDLTRNLPNLLSSLQDEVRYSFDREFGPCEDWTAIGLYGALARVVALLSGLVFVGRPLSREDEWLNLLVTYSVSVISARDAVLKYPVLLRPLVAPFLKEVKTVRRHIARCAELLDPILKAKLAKPNEGKYQFDDLQDGQGNFISWILGRMDGRDQGDPKVLAKNQMVLSFASIHTTTLSIWHAMFDLACRPEYTQPLRDEINKAIAEDGQHVGEGGFFKLNQACVAKLRKLDSFFKESQRLSPPALIANNRVTVAPLSLSTGHTIPKETRVCFPAYAIHTSPLTTAFSPSYNPPSAKPPSEFDGFRFYNLRAMEGKENRHQFVTTAPDSLNFGYGSHACPGRFFAGSIMKVVLVELLRNWDFRLKGDVEGVGGEDKRPRNLSAELAVLPDPRAEIEVRRRKKVEKGSPTCSDDVLSTKVQDHNQS
ncbi:MAG: hypothetical protein M1840_001677 [Geoglossum simile]|nr:MAG: hypothetical protein M1840_001677 [Geoglossum simile]